MNITKKKIENFLYFTRKKIRDFSSALRRYVRAFVEGWDASIAFLKKDKRTHKFVPLIPILLEKEQSERYESELNDALKDAQILNIAITGEYGAGKSSLLKSFEKRHPEYRYAWLSLATFSTNVETGTETNVIDRIEETIVQQLLYSVPAKNLPKTRLKRITQSSFPSLLFQSFILFIWLISILKLYVANLGTGAYTKPDLAIEFFNAINSIYALAAVGFISFYYLYLIVRLASSFAIDGIAFKSGKIETFTHGSVLHKNIDEIVYCFERSDIDVVIIEDLDRYQIQEIFSRLREINFIINRSPQVSRPIRFIYALRDEFFGAGEKTKFFDLVIPVIPVINTGNSKEKLNELLEKRFLHNQSLRSQLNPELIETIALNITDMRLLKNLVNEFDIYADLLFKNLPLNIDKLFAIIAIKNLYPSEYAELLKQKGTILKIFDAFNEWKIQRIANIADQIDRIRKDAEEKRRIIAKDVRELRILIWHAILEMAGAPQSTHIFVEGNRYGFSEFLTDDIFGHVTKYAGDIRAMDRAGYNNGLHQVGNPIKISDVLKKDPSQLGERLRLLLIPDSKFDQEIETLNAERLRVKNETFNRGVEELEFREVIADHFVEMRGMSYLVRSGYFGEDYADYLGYFYQGSLSVEDKAIAISLMDGRLLDVDTKVDDAKAVLANVNLDALDRGRGILIGLIDYLCSPQSSEMGNRVELISTIIKGGVSHLDRLSEATEAFLERSSLQDYIREINRHMPTTLQLILTKGENFKSIELRQKLIAAILDILSKDDLVKLEKNPSTSIRPAVENLENVSALLPNISKSDRDGWKWLRALSPKFSNLDASNPAENLAELIQSGMIRLNHKTLKLIAMRFSDEGSPPLSYKLMTELQVTGLLDVLDSDPEHFVEQLLEEPGMIRESTESLTAILGKIQENEELATQFYERTEAKFDTLNDVPLALWQRIFKEGRVNPSNRMVHSFFEEFLDAKDIDSQDAEAFSLFITENRNILSTEMWSTPESVTDRLQRYLLQEERIDDETIALLFESAEFDDYSIFSEDIPLSRWETLVQLNSVPYTEEVTNLIAENAVELLPEYLALRWKDAKADFDFSSLDIGSVLQLSQRRELNLSDRITLWSDVTAESAAGNALASAEVVNICAQANQSNMPFPPKSRGLLESVVVESSLPQVLRIEAWIQLLRVGTWPSGSAVAAELVSQGIGKMGGSRKFSIENTDINDRLMQTLQSVGVIGSIKEENGMLSGWVRTAS